MKKKLLFGAVVAALALGLVACKQHGDIKWNGGALGSGDGTKTFTVKQKNETKNTIRGMKQFDLLKRHQATCVVQQFDQSKSTCDGMVGFITYYSENTKDPTAANYKTMNFLVVGVRNNCGTTETYASYFCNIKADALSTKNFGCSKTLDKYTESETDPYEVIIVDLPGTGENPTEGIIKNKTFNTKGVLDIAIQFAGNSDGSIDIKWYGDWNTPPASEASATITFDGKMPLLSKKASKDQLGTLVDDSEGVKAKKGTIWAYANILPGETLNARWDLYNVSMAAASYADEEGETLEIGDIFFEEF